MTSLDGALASLSRRLGIAPAESVFTVPDMDEAHAVIEHWRERCSRLERDRAILLAALVEAAGGKIVVHHEHFARANVGSVQCDHSAQDLSLTYTRHLPQKETADALDPS